MVSLASSSTNGHSLAEFFEFGRSDEVMNREPFPVLGLFRDSSGQRGTRHIAHKLLK